MSGRSPIGFETSAVNKVGQSTGLGATASFKPYATAGVTQGNPSCYNCGVTIDVLSTWGSKAGLAVRIGASFRDAKQPVTAHKLFVVDGTFQVASK